MFVSDVTDKFHNKNGFTNAGAAEQTDLTTFGIGSEQVNNFNPGFQHFGGGFQIFIGRSISVNRKFVFGFHGRKPIDGVADYVKHTTQSFFTNTDGDGSAGIFNFDTTLQTVSGGKSNGTDCIVA